MSEITTTHLFREIHEQPAVLRRLLNEQHGTVKQLAALIRERDITHVVIAARGTSDNAGRYAQYALGAMDRLTVGLTTPSLFTIYERPPRFGNALVLGISQSGRSPDIVAVLAEARRQGALTAVLTNKTDSDLAAQGDVVVDLSAGDELAVAATKTYTAELGAIALLAATLSGEPARLAELHSVPDAVEATLAMNEPIATLAPRYRYMERSIVIGRGYNYATAFEMALKLKELTYSIVEPYSSADFLHGPLAMLEPGFPVMVVAPAGLMAEICGRSSTPCASGRRRSLWLAMTPHCWPRRASRCRCPRRCRSGSRPSPPSCRGSCWPCTWRPPVITTSIRPAPFAK